MGRNDKTGMDTEMEKHAHNLGTHAHNLGIHVHNLRTHVHNLETHAAIVLGLGQPILIKLKPQ